MTFLPEIPSAAFVRCSEVKLLVKASKAVDNLSNIFPQTASFSRHLNELSVFRNAFDLSSTSLTFMPLMLASAFASLMFRLGI